MYQMLCHLFMKCSAKLMMHSCNKPLFQKKYYNISQQLLLSSPSPPACMPSQNTAREFTCIFAALSTSISVLL